MSSAPVPATYSWPVMLPVGLRIRVAWDHMPGDDDLHATPENENDRLRITALVPDADELGHFGYGIRIEASKLDGGFTSIENRRWTPADMDLTQGGHLQLIVRHLGMDDAWLNVLPPSIRALAVQGLDDLRSGLMTDNEFRNAVLDAHRKQAR